MQRLRENQMENNSSPFNNRAEGSFLSMQKSEEVARIGGKRRVKSGGVSFFFFNDFFQHKNEGGGETLGKLMARCTATMRGRRSFPGNPEEISKRGATHESSGQMVPFPGSPRA